MESAVGGNDAATHRGPGPAERTQEEKVGRIDEGGVLVQAPNALTLHNLYELPQ